MAQLGRDQWTSLVTALIDLDALDKPGQAIAYDGDCAAFLLPSGGAIVRFGGFLARALRNAGLDDFDRDLFYDDAHTRNMYDGQVLLIFPSVTIAGEE